MKLNWTSDECEPPKKTAWEEIKEFLFSKD